jgi:hypothetical protein
MKKWKVIYFWIIVILFIGLRIPYFQYIASWVPASIPFFFSSKDFTGIYPIMLILWMIEWFLITIYAQSIIKEMKEDNPTKFDLN